MSFSALLKSSTCVRLAACTCALASLSALVPAAHAAPITLSATYYTLSNTDHDTMTPIYGVNANEVKSTLGPDGLPVYNNNSGPNGSYVTDVNGANELTYWSPQFNSNVKYTGSGTITLPYDNSNLFPPNGTGTSNSNGFQTAIFNGLISVPTSETISFSLGADDNAFVYLDGVLACDLGGIHANTPGSCTSSTLSAGTHQLELFYADLHVTQASLDFNVTTAGVTGVTPEPPSIVLLATALLGAGALAIKRRQLAL